MSEQSETNRFIQQGMMQSSAYPHPVEKIQLIETHISWVILTGEFVYKIKKPVELGFLDFTTLEKRRLYCEEEIRLNRRLAPEIYLDVVTINGDMQLPVIGGEGEILEYAVKMRQFPQHTQLDRMLQRGELHENHIDAMAAMVAEFHQDISEDREGDFGSPEQVNQSILDVMGRLRENNSDSESHHLIDSLEQWCRTALVELKSVLQQRKADGFIRECHGDMHLRNLAWLDGKPVAFDCIEFNAELRWIDVISEIAFLIMDLDDRDQAILAQRFLNGYLEHSGDYEGIVVLRLYRVYRALVRAMVDAIRAKQHDVGELEAQEARGEANSYLQLANTYTEIKTPVLIIARGQSASGKTTLTQPILEQLPAIRIRSDVERKRLHGLNSTQHAGADVGQGLYNREATEQTYRRLVELADVVLQSGYSVIVDATAQRRSQRELFYALARRLGLPYVIVEFTAAPDTLRARIVARRGDASDADLNVLEHQLAHWEALGDDESPHSICVDTEKDVHLEQIVVKIRQLVSSLSDTSSTE
ncbi:MAG: AAA family ATPase [Gammaproteobacteria bacterium]|nr:AAA family ATPase [Gammaproteobacteria bacterium]